MRNSKRSNTLERGTNGRHTSSKRNDYDTDNYLDRPLTYEEENAYGVNRGVYDDESEGVLDYEDDRYSRRAYLNEDDEENERYGHYRRGRQGRYGSSQQTGLTGRSSGKFSNEASSLSYGRNREDLKNRSYSEYDIDDRVDQDENDYSLGYQSEYDENYNLSGREGRESSRYGRTGYNENKGGLRYQAINQGQGYQNRYENENLRGYRESLNERAYDEQPYPKKFREQDERLRSRGRFGTTSRISGRDDSNYRGYDENTSYLEGTYQNEYDQKHDRYGRQYGNRGKGRQDRQNDEFELMNSRELRGMVNRDGRMYHAAASNGNRGYSRNLRSSSDRKQKENAQYRDSRGRRNVSVVGRSRKERSTNRVF